MSLQDNELKRLRATVSGAHGTVKQLQSENASLRARLADAVRIASEAADEWDRAPSGMKAGKILLALAGHVPGYRADTDAIHSALSLLPKGGEKK